jgi:hypothetical protein
MKKNANLASDPISLLRELLQELRIDEKTLEVMAGGYSPNRDGIMDFKENEKYYDRFPVVQLSQKIAEDIMNIGINWNVTH